MELERGSQIDRYVVESVIGFGGMAAVYKVRHSKLGTHYALKILTLRSKSIEERLLREGRVQAQLRHPNVVPVIDVVEVGDTPGLVMDFIQGPALDEFLDDRELSLEHAVSIAYGFVSGMQAAHQEGFIHRDLKPANIMLEITKDGVVPKVADFGLAKLVSGDDGLSKTRSGMTMGTPSYMAPEQVRNAKGVDHRADIFAIGAIIYEMVSGQQAFPGEDVLEIFVKLSNGERIPITELCPDLPEPLVRAIEGSLAINPEERIADCGVILDLLRKAVASDIDPRASIKFDADFMERARLISTAGSRTGVESVGATDSWGPTDLPKEKNEGPEVSTLAGGNSASAFSSSYTSEAAPTIGPDDFEDAPKSGLVRKGAAAGALGFVGLGVIVLVALGIGGIGAGAYFYEDILSMFSGEAVVAVDDDDDAAATDDDDAAGDDDGAKAAGSDGGDGGDGSADVNDVGGDLSGDDDDAVEEPAPAPALSNCSNLAEFEDAAVKGELGSAASGCLSKRMRDASLSQTDQDKAGRVVLIDAKKRCDSGKSCKDYEREQVYFFEEITRSDVNMLFNYTAHVADKGKHKEVVNWGNKTLDRKQQWEPAQFVEQVPKVLEMIARAQYARFQADSSNNRQRKAAEGAAVDWANKLIELSRDYKVALDMCASASGSEETCMKRIFPEKTVAPITLASTPPGATIRVDGETQSGVTPLVVEIEFGEHDIEMEAGGKVGKQRIKVGTTEKTKWKWNYKDNTFEGQ